MSGRLSYIKLENKKIANIAIVNVLYVCAVNGARDNEKGEFYDNMDEM